jgi:hypothetical protein
MSFKQSFSALTLWSSLIVLGQSPHWLASRVAKATAVYLDSTQFTLYLPAMPIPIDWLPANRLLVISESEELLVRTEPGGSLLVQASFNRNINQQGDPTCVD